MKNYFKLFGIITIVALISFSFLACEDESESESEKNPFHGIWFQPGENMLYVTFSDDGVVEFKSGLTNRYLESGTYIWEGKTATIYMKGEKMNVNFVPGEYQEYLEIEGKSRRYGRDKMPKRNKIEKFLDRIFR